MAKTSQVGERALVPLDKKWVDFKAVKEAVSMEMVLARYHIENLKPSPTGELRGPCPIHHGSGQQFSVNTAKNAFQCFFSGCKARGNVLDLVAALDECSVRDAAQKLAEWFGVREQGSDAAKGEAVNQSDNDTSIVKKMIEHWDRQAARHRKKAATLEQFIASAKHLLQTKEGE